jgi:hypothetical protein
MRVSDHRAKAERIERTLARCTLDDYETVIEACMLAGTHWFNVLLHRTALLGDSDIMHAEFLSAAARRKVRVTLAGPLEALDEIERLRTTHVRGDMANGRGAAALAIECLEVLRRAAE